MLKRVVKKALGVKPSPLKDYLFSIDVIEPTMIAGWAKNIKLPKHAPVIDVYGGGILIWQAHANQSRSDLTEKGIGDFAFALVPNPKVLERELEEIEIRIDGHVIENGSFPFSMTPTAPNSDAREGEAHGQVQVEQEETPPIGAITCFVDIVDATRVTGWARVDGKESHRPFVQIRHGNTVLASGFAGKFRPDLLEAGIGDGHFGFDLSFDLASFPSAALGAQVFVDGTCLPDHTLSLEVSSDEIAREKFLKAHAPQLLDLNARVEKELEKLEVEISNICDGEPSVSEVLQFVLRNIAELNVRNAVMEEALIKFVSK